MLNDNVSRILRENRECRDILYLLYSVSYGKPSKIVKPSYVNRASEELHLPIRTIEDNLFRLKEIRLIDNNGQTIRLKEEASKYVPGYLKKRVESK